MRQSSVSGCRYLENYEWLACLSYFDGCCAYCGTSKKRLTADHLVAKSKGGKDELSNIVPACEECNQAKRDKDWREYIMGTACFSQERMNKIFAWRRIARNV